MTREIDSRVLALDLADGRLPDGVAAESRDGRSYLAMIAAIRANLERASQPTQAQINKIVPILRGGGGDDA